MFPNIRSHQRKSIAEKTTIKKDNVKDSTRRKCKPDQVLSQLAKSIALIAIPQNVKYELNMN